MAVFPQNILQHFQNALNMVPALLGCLCILLKDSECTKCGRIDWDNISYVSVTSSCSNVSKSEQFVSICGRNSNLAAITISAATFDLKQ